MFLPTMGDPIQVYADRVARKAVLRQFVEPSHPVLQEEEMLIAQAELDLRRSLGSRMYAHDTLAILRARCQAALKERERADDNEIGPQVWEDAMASLDEILPARQMARGA